MTTSDDNGLTWSVPELVNLSGMNDDGTVSGDFDSFPQIAVADDGTVHAVWMSFVDTLFSPPIPDSFTKDIFYAQKPAGGSWGPTELVNDAYARTILKEDRYPQLVLDSSGVPSVLWVSESDYKGAGTDADIFYSTRAGGTWSDPEFVNSAAADGSATDVDVACAFSPDGLLHAVWSSNLDIQGAGNDADLFYNVRTGGAWQSPQLLHELGRVAEDAGVEDNQPDIVFGKEGLMFVAWRSTFPDISFTSGDDPDILNTVVDVNGTLPSASLVILANASGHADGKGSPPYPNEGSPSIDIDNYGRIHFVWESYEDLGGTIGPDSDILYARTLLPLVEEANSGWMLY
jgi:hypothetical protein